MTGPDQTLLSILEKPHQIKDEKRTWHRHVVVTDVLVTPVDDALREQRKSFRGITKDVSSNGLSFYHAAPITTEFVVLTIKLADDAAARLLFKVVRSRIVFEGRYFTAGMFVRRFDQTA